MKKETIGKMAELLLAVIGLISPHYRSERRRQVSGGVFGGSMALSEDYRDKCHKI